MTNLDLSSMFFMGLLGTGHCLGMCGPLVLAFPAVTGRFSSHLFYHLGRSTTYVAVGTLMGAFGAGLSLLAGKGGDEPLDWVVRMQVGLSLLAAFFLLLFGLARLGFLKEPGWMSLISPSRLPGFRWIMSSAAQSKNDISMFFLGVILGFLPCGLSFAAFVRALAAGGAVRGWDVDGPFCSRYDSGSSFDRHRPVPDRDKTSQSLEHSFRDGHDRDGRFSAFRWITGFLT